MKIYLASFLQPENFGPGTIYGIVTGSRPKNVKVDLVFQPFTPPVELINSYNDMRTSQPKEAGEMFTSQYKAQLESFVSAVKEALPRDNSLLTDLLPFKDGDTLASWERAEFTNYRKILAPFLEQLGYEVVLK